MHSAFDMVYLIAVAADEGKPVETKEDGEVTLEKSLDPESSEKHKLEHAWTLWFDNPSSGSKQPSTWGQTLRAVYTFSTVEDFWWYVLVSICGLSSCWLQVVDRLIDSLAWRILWRVLH